MAVTKSDKNPRPLPSDTGNGLMMKMHIICPFANTCYVFAGAGAAAMCDLFIKFAPAISD
jgi:hypothetical protein